LIQSSLSRYAVECPVCETRFRPGTGKSRIGMTTFSCPACGEVLESAPRHDTLLMFTSIAVGVIFAYKFGYRGLIFAVVTAVAAFLTFFVLVGILFYTRPPKAQVSLKNGDAGLRLTDKRRR
jgi:hypothetical protein